MLIQECLVNFTKAASVRDRSPNFFEATLKLSLISFRKSERSWRDGYLPSNSRLPTNSRYLKRRSNGSCSRLLV